jgi:hypothetical protein
VHYVSRGQNVVGNDLQGCPSCTLSPARHISEQFSVPPSHIDRLFLLVSWPLSQVGPMSWTPYILATDVRSPDMFHCSLSPADFTCFVIPKVDATAVNRVVPAYHLTSTTVQVCFNACAFSQDDDLLTCLITNLPCSNVQLPQAAKINIFHYRYPTFLLHLLESHQQFHVSLWIPLANHYQHLFSRGLHSGEGTAPLFMQKPAPLSRDRQTYCHSANANALASAISAPPCLIRQLPSQTISSCHQTIGSLHREVCPPFRINLPLPTKASHTSFSTHICSFQSSFLQQLQHAAKRVFRTPANARLSRSLPPFVAPLGSFLLLQQLRFDKCCSPFYTRVASVLPFKNMHIDVASLSTATMASVAPAARPIVEVTPWSRAQLIERGHASLLQALTLTEIRRVGNRTLHALRGPGIRSTMTPDDLLTFARVTL